MIHLRRLILHDFWLKLFSLVLAVLLWVTISFAFRKQGSPLGNLKLGFHQTTFYSIPVVILSSASDVHEFRVDPKEVDVTVQGDPAVLRALQSAEIRAIVDLTGISEASDVRKRIEVSTPAGVTHVKVTPEEVRVLVPGSAGKK